MTDTPLLDAFRSHEHARIGLAFHEATHAVAGMLHGGKLTRAALTDGTRKGAPIGRPRGATTFASLPSGRHAFVAYAGRGRRPGVGWDVGPARVTSQQCSTPPAAGTPARS